MLVCKSGPLSFSLFINDVVSYLRQECGHGRFVSQDTEEIIVLMYADDIANSSDTVACLKNKLILCSSFVVQ